MAITYHENRVKTLVSITQAKLNIFLQKSLSKTRIFVDDIQIKFYNANKYQLADVIDWLAYMEHLQSIFTKFYVVAPPIDNILIPYFWDGLRLFIHVQLDEKNHNLDNWQAVVKQVVCAKAKTAWQNPWFVRKSDTCCLYGYRQVNNEEFKDQKNSKAKKNDFSIANGDNGDWNEPNQILGWSSKNNSCLNRGDQ